MKFEFRTIKYHDFNARNSDLVMETLYEFNFQYKIARCTFHVVKGARDPECVLLSRENHEDHKILH